MKNILIPTDFSENSQNAIRYALDYFVDIPVNLFILHVSIPGISQADKISHAIHGYSKEEDMIQSRSSLLEEEIRSFQFLAKNPNHKFYALQESGLLVEAIRKQIIEKEIDVILMGTQGDLSLNEDKGGSKTYDVITKVKCPIMVIPEHARFKGIKNIAFVTDYNCIYRNKLIRVLSEAIELHRSPLRVLNVRPQNSSLTPSQVDNKGFLHYFFRETKHSFHFLENKNMETGFQDFVDTWEINMIAIAAKNLNFIQRLMLRPTSGGCNYHTEVPFLVLHE